MAQEEMDALEDFTQLVRANRRTVFSVAYAKVRNVQDAEDITQEVFAEAYRKMEILADHKNVAGWLFKAAIFRSKDHLRKAWRRQKRETIYADLAYSSIEEQKGESLSDGLLAIISELPEKHRSVLLLKHFAKLSYAEISQMTGLSKTTIDGRLRSAKKELKARLQKIQEADYDR